MTTPQQIRLLAILHSELMLLNHKSARELFDVIHSTGTMCRKLWNTCDLKKYDEFRLVAATPWVEIFGPTFVDHITSSITTFNDFKLPTSAKLAHLLYLT